MKASEIFRNKTVLITGASGGIGRNFALMFAKSGANLILTGRNSQRLEALKKEVSGVKCEIFTADLSVLEEARSLVEKIEKNGLNVDVLVNNAGFVTYGYFHKLDIKRELDEIAVNVVAPVFLTHHFISKMAMRNSGWVLNIASTAALLPCCPFEAVYGATKSFISSFSMALSREYKGKNVHVACLYPGNTDTDFWECMHLKRKYSHCRNKMADPEKIAEFGLEMLVNGKDLAVFEKSTGFKAFFMKFIPKSLVSYLIYKRHYDSFLED